MADTTIMNEKARREVAELIGNETREGLVPTLVLLGTGLVERTASTGIGVLRDVSTEAKEIVGSALDLVEAWSKSSLRLTRKLTERAQSLADDSFERSEHAVRGMLRALRIGSESATGAAGQAINAVVGRAVASGSIPRSSASA